MKVEMLGKRSKFALKNSYLIIFFKMYSLEGYINYIYLLQQSFIESFSERNHARGSTKCTRICLACKMKSEKKKQGIGKIELTSSRSWIMFDVSMHVNYHIVWLTRMWHFGMITSVLPEYTGDASIWVLATYNKTSLGFRLLEKIVGEGNLLSFLLRCGTRPYERGTQWDSNSLM